MGATQKRCVKLFICIAFLPLSRSSRLLDRLRFLGHHRCYRLRPTAQYRAAIAPQGRSQWPRLHTERTRLASMCYDALVLTHLRLSGTRMPRLTITLSDERHTALREAAAQRRKTIGQLIEESLEF